MADVDDDASRVQTALDALEGVTAVNLNEEDFENYQTAVTQLEELEDSLVQKPDCSIDLREGGDQA